MSESKVEQRKRRLNRYALQSFARDLVPSERVAWCLRRLSVDPMTGRAHTHVKHMFDRVYDHSHYKNLIVCGSVWMCPVCSSKITERRREELKQGLENTDLEIVMVTLTLSHHLETELNQKDNLKRLLADLKKVYQKLRRGKRWDEFAKLIGYEGSIRALEVTHGEKNGWHPHLHLLLFLRIKPDAKELKGFFWDRWSKLLAKSGRLANYTHGVDVTIARLTVAEYMTKFGCEPKEDKRRNLGVDFEMAKFPTKNSRSAAGSTPLQLLTDYMNGNKQAGVLWKNYAQAFKGQRQLCWSKDLRSILGLKTEKTDEQLAKEERQESDVLAQYNKLVWRIIDANDARGELLEVANESHGDFAAVIDYLRKLGVPAYLLPGCKPNQRV